MHEELSFYLSSSNSLRLRPLNFVHGVHRWLPCLVTGNIIDGADRPEGDAHSIVFNIPFIETNRRRDDVIMVGDLLVQLLLLFSRASNDIDRDLLVRAMWAAFSGALR